MTEKMQLNAGEIVADLISILDSSRLTEISKMKENDLALLHHGFGTWIRNTYGLWLCNPLTEQWRTKPETHDIRNGVDYSADHPDAVSTTIIKQLWLRLRGGE